jgi:hypothetical protein
MKRFFAAVAIAATLTSLPAGLAQGATKTQALTQFTLGKTKYQAHLVLPTDKVYLVSYLVVTPVGVTATKVVYDKKVPQVVWFDYSTALTDTAVIKAVVLLSQTKDVDEQLTVNNVVGPSKAEQAWRAKGHTNKLLTLEFTLPVQGAK